MADDLQYLRFVKGTWYVRVQVPADVQPILGKKEFWETCKTSDLKVAQKVRDPIAAKFKAMIERARLQGSASPKLPLARLALAAWVNKGLDHSFGNTKDTTTAYLIVHTVEAYRKAWEEPDGYLAIPGFDRALATVLTAYGCPAKEGDPVVAGIRQEAALTFMYALQHHERARLSYAHLNRAQEIARTDFETIATYTPMPERVLPPPAKRLSEIYAAWIEWKKPNAKDKPILKNHYRRLIEFFGDRPGNHITAPEVAEYMKLVARLPASKRTKEEAKMTIRELTVKDHPKPLTAKTVGRWKASHSQMFRHAMSLGTVETNPFGGDPQFIVTGRKSTDKRAFSEAELNKIFAAPIFHGHDGSDAHRSAPGTRLEKDGYYWLPILSFLTGGRQGECANMRLDEVKNIGKVYYFDLSGREVGAEDGSESIKNDQSKREIPFHPKLAELGFIDYVEARRTEPGDGWLFPDLSHDTKTGAATQFSRWWAVWMDKHGLPEPEINHHSWRHAFKRYARKSKVKEELHDILSGHKANTVSRKYGEGAPILDLAREMAKIRIPIPKLP